jgi:hypothetical protein
MAANVLRQHLRDGLEPSELTEIAQSVAGQWRRFDGHACIFLDSRRAMFVRVTPAANGTFDIKIRKESADFVRHLATFGVAPEDVSDVLVRMNLAETFEYVDEKGVRRILSHDPRARQFFVEPPDGIPRLSKPITPPVACPKCTAVLAHWPAGARQQTCRFCGHVVSLP